MHVLVLPTQGRRHLLTILVDEEEWRFVHIDIFGKTLHLPCVRTQEDLTEALSRLELQGVRKYVLNKLARRSYPSAELEKLLTERLVSEPIRALILNECRHNGYLNDSEWTERFVASQMRKGQGPRAIQQKLRAKGVAAPSLPNEQHAQIQTLLETKYHNKNLSDPKERQKVTASLIRRGFDFDAIRTGLAKVQ